jgi:hypothetical protein
VCLCIGRRFYCGTLFVGNFVQTAVPTCISSFDVVLPFCSLGCSNRLVFISNTSKFSKMDVVYVGECTVKFEITFYSVYMVMKCKVFYTARVK